MGELRNWAKKKMEYIKLEDEETITCRYLGFKISPSRFEEDQETVKYLLEVGGIEKTFESRSATIALEFDRVNINDWIELTRHGLGNKTKYFIKRVGEKKEE